MLNRNADLRMIGGRNEMDAEFDVGFDDEGLCGHRRCLAHSLLADPCPLLQCTRHSVMRGEADVHSSGKHVHVLSLRRK